MELKEAVFQRGVTRVQIGVIQSKGAARCPILGEVMAENLGDPTRAKESVPLSDCQIEAGPLDYLSHRVERGCYSTYFNCPEVGVFLNSSTFKIRADWQIV